MSYISAPGMKGVVKEKIVEVVCKEYGLTKEELQRKGRAFNLVEARQITTYLLRVYTKSTWSEIGKCFNQDHTTALHSYTAVRDHMDTEDDYKNHVMKLVQIIFR